MKKQLVQSIVVATLALSSPWSMAVDEHHKDDAKKSAVPPKPAGTPSQQVGSGDQMKMQQHMQQMREQMDRIQKTTDPRERQRLLDAHHQTMMEGMKAMRSMGGPPMGGMRGDGKGMPMGGADSAARAAQMEQRMDMMQMMMEQMMQREQMRAPPK